MDPRKHLIALATTTLFIAPSTVLAADSANACREIVKDMIEQQLQPRSHTRSTRHDLRMQRPRRERAPSPEPEAMEEIPRISDATSSVRSSMGNVAVGRGGLGSRGIGHGGGGKMKPSRIAKARKPSAPMSRFGSLDSATDSYKRDRRSVARKRRSDRGPSHYSRTNTQELNVDEGDIVKTDGRYIYHVSCNRSGPASACRNEIRIFKSWPATRTRLLARYTVPTQNQAVHIQQIYLQGRTVVVVMKNQSGRRNTPQVRVALLNVKNPAKPRLEREFDIDGAFVESRMIADRLYLATHSPAFSIPAALINEVRQNLRWSSRRKLARSVAIDRALEDLDHKWDNFIHVNPGLPQAKERTTGRKYKAIYDCEQLHADKLTRGNRLLNLVQIDLGQHRTRKMVTGAGVWGYSTQSKVYASEASFYIADMVSAHHNPRWQTASLIRKFDLQSKRGPKFIGSGMVRGRLLNQFAMSEHADHLRVATSDNWASNNLYVLHASDGRLNTIGSLENLARNERIYAVRMMGDKGYIVTFRRTDPLYTLDLSNPEIPKVVGELKIEGFSNYLHPLDNNHLLAIGQDADSRGRATGFHMQIFDVTDPRRPRRTFHEKLEAGSGSAAQGNHHAVMFETNTNTLALPWKGKNYWGLIAYHVDAETGFRSLGRVNHASMYKQYFQRTCKTLDSGDCAKRNYWWRMFSRQDLAIDRVIAIDKNLYSFSSSGAMIHSVGRKLRHRKSVLVNQPKWPSRARALRRAYSAR
jgi:hypothetical protein